MWMVRTRYWTASRGSRVFARSMAPHVTTTCRGVLHVESRTSVCDGAMVHGADGPVRPDVRHSPNPGYDQAVHAGPLHRFRHARRTSAYQDPSLDSKRRSPADQPRAADVGA